MVSCVNNEIDLPNKQYFLTKYKSQQCERHLDYAVSAQKGATNMDLLDAYRLTGLGTVTNSGGRYDYHLEQRLRTNAIAMDMCNAIPDDCGQKKQKNISATPNKQNSTDQVPRQKTEY